MLGMTSSHRVELSPLQLFNKYIKKDDGEQVDASEVLSVECYTEWLATRKVFPKNPAEAFRKILTGHCRGDNGLLPFAPRVEKAVLEVLRERKVWPCFKGTNIRIGERGLKTQGYWETRDATAQVSRKRASSEPICKVESQLRRRLMKFENNECKQMLRTQSWNCSTSFEMNIKIEDVNSLFLKEAAQSKSMNMELSDEEIMKLSLP